MKKFIFRPNVIWLVGILLLVGLPFLIAQTAGPKVSGIEIKHIGPPAASEAVIRGNIRVKEGDVFQRILVDEDIKNLYGTGFFYNIRVVENHTADGVNLAYTFQGNPTLTDIRFTGNTKYSRKKLLNRVIGSSDTTKQQDFAFGKDKAKPNLDKMVGLPLNENRLFLAGQEIQRMYEKAGYEGTTVKYTLSIDENAGRGTVTFEITEKAKVRISKIEFEGANSIPAKKLRKALKTKQRWMFSWLTGSNKIKREQMEDDKERLLEFYQNEGFIDFVLNDVKFDYTEPKKVKLTFVVTEGQKYKVGAVDFAGNTLFTSEEIQKGIFVNGKPVLPAMGVGTTFTPKGLSKDVEAISDFYGSKGYIDSRVHAIKKPNTTTGTMDLVYEVTEGEKAFVERIDIKGNDKTKDKVIRRELAISPGEVFDTTRVKLSEDRLRNLNYFEKVDARPEDTDIAPSRKNLVVGVEEKNTGNFTIGAGFSSEDAIVGFVEVSQANFDLFKPPTFSGAGQKFRLRAQLGTERADYVISFVEPWFLDRKLAFGVDLFHRELDYVSRNDVYDETHTGATLSLTKALGSEFLIGKLSYTLEHIDVGIGSGFHTNPPANISTDIWDEQGGRLVSSIGTSIAFDTRNSPFLPNRGQRSELITQLAGVGGDTHFYRLEGRTAWYFPGFAEGHILEVIGRAGIIDEYGDGDRGRARVPISDRYFLGGMYSLRGYRYREIGPRDSFGEPIGGETFLFGSAEYSIPVIERVRVAAFYDIGNVFSTAYSFDAPGRKFLSDNVGVGLRLRLPIGDLRFDYGFPIQHDSNVGGSGRLQFGVGSTREF